MDSSPEKKRVQWSYEEQAFVAAIKKAEPNATTRQLYQKVMKSPEAKAIFHANHVIDWKKFDYVVKMLKANNGAPK